GRSIDCLLKPGCVQEKPRLYGALLHSLIMFNEGCTSSVDQLSVSKFVSSLDVLTEGEAQKGVKDLLCTCFSKEATDKLTEDGLTIESFVQQIYSKGRSRMFHGRNETLDHDWSRLRDLTQLIVRYVLIFCANQVASGTDSDNPKIVFLKGRRSTVKPNKLTV